MRLEAPSRPKDHVWSHEASRGVATSGEAVTGKSLRPRLATPRAACYPNAALAKIVYIDTCHLTDLAKGALGITVLDGPDAALATRLREKALADDILCPFSIWHVSELAKYRNADVQAEAARLLGALSRARAFRHFLDISADEVTRALFRGLCPTVSALGSPTAFVPQEAASLDTVIIPGLNTSSPEELVQLIARSIGNSEYVASVRAFSDSLHAADLALWDERRASPVRLDDAIKLELDDLLKSKITREQIAAVTGVTGRSGASILAARTPQALISMGLYGYATMVGILARRRIDPGRRPRPSDPMDIGHLTLLPYCHAFLTERYAASFARPVARDFKVEVFAKREELLEWLDDVEEAVQV